jgi:hypothetical protein
MSEILVDGPFGTVSASIGDGPMWVHPPKWRECEKCGARWNRHDTDTECPFCVEHPTVEECDDCKWVAKNAALKAEVERLRGWYEAIMDCEHVRRCFRPCSRCGGPVSNDRNCCSWCHTITPDTAAGRGEGVK